MPSAAAQDVLQAILEQRAAAKRREMAAPRAGPPAVLPFAKHAADPASLPFADRWHNSLANRILSAPSKLFGGLVVDPAMDLATLAGDVIHGRQPTMAADPQTGEFHTDPGLADRAMNAAGMLTLGAGAVPAEANALRAGASAVKSGMRPISNLSDLRASLQEEGPFFVRWSESKHDMRPGAVSKDYQSGKMHEGLSAVEIDHTLSDSQLVRLLRDYNPGRGAGRPNIYKGRVVGTDSDGSPSIAVDKHIGTLSDDLTKFVTDESVARRLELEDWIETNKRALESYKTNPPDFIPPYSEATLKAAEENLRNLGGPVDRRFLQELPFATQNSATAAIGPARQGIRAYHGSPHDFERFDSSRIGTGEGAQAYGHGMYFGEREGVAKEYRDALSNPRVLVGGKPINNPNPVEDSALAHLEAASKDADPVASAILHAKHAASIDTGRTSKLLQDAANLLEQWKKKGITLEPGGHMYQVDIAADPEHFLDWDKPLSEQSPKVREAIAPLYGEAMSRLNKTLAGYGRPPLSADMSDKAAAFYGNLDAARQSVHRGNVTGDKASEALREAGVPGIRYLDQGSRGKPQWTVDGEPLNWVDASVLNDYRVKGAASLEKAISEARDAGRDAHVTFLEGLRGKKLDDGGTRNFVIFPGNEHLISILKKYGLPISAAGLAALSQLHPQEAQAAQKQRQ